MVQSPSVYSLQCWPHPPGRGYLHLATPYPHHLSTYSLFLRELSD